MRSPKRHKVSIGIASESGTTPATLKNPDAFKKKCILTDKTNIYSNEEKSDNKPEKKSKVLVSNIKDSILAFHEQSRPYGNNKTILRPYAGRRSNFEKPDYPIHRRLGSAASSLADNFRIFTNAKFVLLAQSYIYHFLNWFRINNFDCMMHLPNNCDVDEGVKSCLRRDNPLNNLSDVDKRKDTSMLAYPALPDYEGYRVISNLKIGRCVISVRVEKPRHKISESVLLLQIDNNMTVEVNDIIFLSGKYFHEEEIEGIKTKIYHKWKISKNKVRICSVRN